MIIGKGLRLGIHTPYQQLGLSRVNVLWEEYLGNICGKNKKNTMGVLLPFVCNWITFWENSHWQMHVQKKIDSTNQNPCPMWNAAHIPVFLLDNPRGLICFGFWSLVCFTVTHPTTQLRQRCIQVVRSNKEARKRLTKPNGTPAMDFGCEQICKCKYTQTKNRTKHTTTIVS